MRKSPKPNGNNGNQRNRSGQFVRGNTAAKGHVNPSAAKRQKLHVAFMKAVKIKDIRAIITSLVAQAKGGDTQAAKLLLDRIFGKPEQFVEMKNSSEPKLINWPLKPPQKKKNKTSGLIGQQSKEGK